MSFAPPSFSQKCFKRYAVGAGKLSTPCGRGAGTHGDVLNLHTEVFEMDTRGRGGRKEGEGRGVTVSSANHETAHVELSRASEGHRKKPLVLTH